MASGAPGGAAHAQVVSLLAEGLDSDAYRLEGWFLDEPGPLLEELRGQGVRVRFVRFRGIGDVGGGIRLARLFVRTRPSLIHLHVGGRSTSWIVERFSSAKVIAHLHGAFDDDDQPLDLEHRTNTADAVIAVSRALAEAAPSKATVVYPGVRASPARKEPEQSAAPLIGTAARLVPVKRLDDLLRACALLCERHPAIRLEIAGAGSCDKELRQLADLLKIADRTTFLGWLGDLSPAHGRWHLFAMPSSHEGFPLAALEAMAAGLPVVASDVDGLRELVVDGTTGFLVPVGDIDSLASRIDVLLGDAQLRARMGQASRARAREFSRERAVEGIRAVYERLLGA